MKYKLITVTILAILVLMGMANDPLAIVNKKSESVPVHSISDTLTVSELKKQISGVFPDSTAVPDSLLLKKFVDFCKSKGYNMPVFEPDEELTASMPQIMPENVDPGILIPGYMQCLNGLKGEKEQK